MQENTVKSGQINGHYYNLMRRDRYAVLAGAAPYIIYVDNEYYCTCESRREADEEIKGLRS